MIRCVFTRDAIHEMLPIFTDDGFIARRVSNSTLHVTENQVRKMRAGRYRPNR